MVPQASSSDSKGPVMERVKTDGQGTEQGVKRGRQAFRSDHLANL